MSGQCYEVPPLRRTQIRAAAVSFRDLLNWDEPHFPVIEVLEFGLPELLPGFEYQICTAAELGDNHGLTYPDQRKIKIREDVYEAACDGEGFYRLTIAHEFGHQLLHTDLGLARSVPTGELPAYRDSEWQANCFAGELLVCHRHAHKCRSADAAMEIFGVSRQAAEYQLGIYRKEKII